MRFKLPRNFILRAVSVVLSVTVLGTVLGKPVRSYALFDPDKAINYQTFASRTTVEDSVLFIGTYIIHKDALTDDLYQKALDSGSESGQSDIYYKSEISDGQWFETGTIDNGIRGISIEGLPVSIDTINPLYVTYYVGADGILKDAKTMAAINPFDLPDPYDLAGLPELDPIRSQYTSSNSATTISQEDFLSNRNSTDTGNIRSDVYLYQLLSAFFSLDIRDAQTDKLDQQLKDLNNVYISLKGAGQDEEAKLVYDLMAKIDASRRAIVMEKLSELDDNLLNALYELCSGSNYTPYGDFKDASNDKNPDRDENIKKMEDSTKHHFLSLEGVAPILKVLFKTINVVSNNGWWTVIEKDERDRESRAIEANRDNEDYVYDEAPTENPFNADSALLDAIGTSIGNCGNSYTTYLSEALVDSDDLLGHVIYDYSVQVIDQSTGGGLGGPVTFLKHATNIRDDVISDKEGELALLKSSLLSMGSSRYTQAATAGTNSDYASLSSEGAKKSSLEDQKTDEEGKRAMFQYLIEAMRQRSDAPSALEYVNERINITEELLTQIPSDEFKTYSTSSVQAHLVWLKDEAQKIIDSDEDLKSKLDQLKEKKEELQKKRDQCLDNNDLAGAKAYDAKIAAVDQDIDKENQNLIKGDLDDLNKKKNDALDKGDKDAAAKIDEDIDALKNNADANSLTDGLVDKAMNKLADDQNADLSGVAQALADVGATDKLDDLADKAAQSGASDSTLAGIQNAKDSMNDKKALADADDLMAELEGLMGKDIDDMSDMEKAEADAVLSKLAKSGGDGSGSGSGDGSGSGSGLGNGSGAAQDKAKQLTNQLLNEANAYLYRQLDGDKSTEFVNMFTVSNITGFRYFYDDTKAVGTMTQGTKVYIFNRGSDEMHKQSATADPESMKKEAAYQNYLYITEDDAENYFGCKAEYIKGTDYAVCLTPTMQTNVDELVEQMQEYLQQ